MIGSELIGFDGCGGLMEMKCWWRWWWKCF